ncbi:MAG: gliding motility-associated C-terminal domain-containing protein [Ginsengibacter sp.]
MNKRIFIKRFLLFALGLVVFNNLIAQLCQGSLGDPVVNITFGSGPNTGPPLSASLNEYSYVSNTCPNDNFYTIANSTNNCFGDSWLTLSEDHTPGDIDGYMMVVNASVMPSLFYIQDVGGLCGGTTYEFAAWMVNVLRPTACAGNGNRPNITFDIETTTGQALQTYSTGDIDATSSPVWKQYGLFFTTPPGVSSVKIKIFNNAAGGCGNDLALDDITFRPCGPKASINVNGVADIKDVCTGDMTVLNFGSVIVGGYVNTFYQWQKSNDSISWTDIPGANGSQYSIPAIVTPGKYFFRLAVAEGNNISISSCRIASDFVTVNVNALPVTAASNNGPACVGTALTVTATGGASYLWTGPGNFSANMQSPVIPNILVSNSGLYHVKVTSQAGCISNDSTTVVINLNPVADAGTDVNICEGATTKLQGSQINATFYKWFPPMGLSDPLSLAPVASPSETISYILTVSDGVCKDSASVLVSVIKAPTANAGPDKVVVGNQTAVLEGQVSGSNVTYFWTPDLYISSDSILTPQVSPPYDTTYTLHVISNDGCGTATDKVLVKYFKDIYIPNAFTPDENGLNDRWNLPSLTAFPLAEVSVYNRYGQLIFYNKGYTRQWDGTFKGMPQPAGVYIFIVDLKNGLKKLHGTLTLLR